MFPDDGASPLTFEVGDVVWQSAPEAGRVLGTRCLAAGTQGTLVGVTGDIANGSDLLTVSDYTSVDMDFVNPTFEDFVAVPVPPGDAGPYTLQAAGGVMSWV